LLDRLARQRPRQDEQPVVIIGAGDAGEMALRWILMNPGFNFRPLGFLDPDPYLVGRQIHGVEVLGGPEKLPQVLDRYSLAGVILALPPDQLPQIDELAALCKQHHCWLRTLHLEFEPI
jgi:FlaA1/EpsC-like NDP-sugar epimerase